MTSYDPETYRSHLNALPQFAEAHRILRPLVWTGCVYLLCALVVFAVFAADAVPLPLRAVYGQIRDEGWPGVAIASLLLAAAGLIACASVVWARHCDASGSRAPNAPDAGLSVGRVRRTAGWAGSRHGMVSWVAGWPHATMILLFAAAAAVCLCCFWPQRILPSPTLSSQAWFGVAGATSVLVFPLLIAERYFGAIPQSRLPESRNLQILLFVPVIALAAEAVLQAATGLGLAWTYWLRAALALVLVGIATELAVRALAVWFLPPPETTRAHAAIGSIVAALLRPRAVSPEALAETIRNTLGIDFSRSWAIGYVRRAFAPVLLLMLAFSWFLSGVTRIDLNERGVYQRLGVPAAVLNPGLHVVLPWPFGIVRHVEYGVLHSVPISYGDHDAGSGGTAAPDISTAEGTPPAGSNRLWDVAQPSDVAYLIASDSAGRQSFETISVSLRVLFRIGLDNEAARRALYRVEDPDALVRTLSGQKLAEFFASRTLAGVLGTDQVAIANGLRAQLQQELDRLRTGLEIVAVVVEAIHPPIGAATAYRNVQAAQIVATTDIASERGRAQTTSSVARSAPRDATDNAQGVAAATVSKARVVLRNLEADELAYSSAGEPFLLERYFANLKSALANSSIEIIDHRLNDPNAPMIDLRPTAGRGGNGAGYEGKTP